MSRRVVVGPLVVGLSLLAATLAGRETARPAARDRLCREILRAPPDPAPRPGPRDRPVAEPAPKLPAVTPAESDPLLEGLADVDPEPHLQQLAILAAQPIAPALRAKIRGGLLRFAAASPSARLEGIARSVALFYGGPDLEGLR